MKIKKLILAMTLAMSLTAVAWGQSSMSVDHVDGLWGTSTDTVNIDQLITFHIRLTNGSGGNITGHTTGFRIYSPTGSEWNTTVGTFTDGAAISSGGTDLSTLSNNVDAYIVSDANAFAATTKHSNGSKVYGSSSDSTKIYSDTGTFAKPSASDSSAFDGWKPL